jgi:tetratricopeptide (TPR) repeat protein
VSKRINLAIVVGVFGILGSTTGFAQDACAGQKISKKVDKPIGAAEKAFQAKNWDEVIAKVAEAEAMTDVVMTDFDKYWLHEFRGRAMLQKQNYPEALKDLEASAASPCMPPADVQSRQKILIQLAYQTKAYPKVIEVGNKALAANGDPELGTYVGNAYYATEDYENSRRIMKDVVAKQEAAGTKVEDLTYRILQGSCIKLKDNPCVIDMLEKLVTHYPTRDYWQDLIGLMLAQTKNNNQLLNIWRVAESADALTEGAEYTEFAQLAIGQGLPGEAQAVLDRGFQKGVFAKTGKESANQLLAEAKNAVTLDKSTLEKQDASAKAKPTGDNDVKLGAAYLSYGMNDKAIEALQRGLGKGGVKNPDDAGLLLGMAYLRAGNKAEAAKAFATVKADPIYARVARLWALKAI